MFAGYDSFSNRPMKIITEPQCIDYSRCGNPEAPQRVSQTLEALRAQPFLPLTWGEPIAVSDDVILRAHDPELLQRLTLPEDFDEDTPAYPNVLHLARRSVGGALAALGAAREGDIGFSIMRPPGHHATRTQAMGFCYLNSIAVAALEARATGFQRVAVLDFDVHHGNGTEAILLGQPGVVFVSVHESGYPHTGREHRGSNCYNFPAPPYTSREDYCARLSAGLATIKGFNPDLLAVSAGFDAYREDPLSDQALEIEDYCWLGDLIRKLDVPVFGILEGGYSSALPQLVLSFLCGLAGKTNAAAPRSIP